MAPVLDSVVDDGSAGTWLLAGVGGAVMERGLLDDVLRCSKDELCGVGEVCPFFGEDFFDEEFIFEVFKWLDVKAANFLREFDDGGVVGVFQLLE